MSLFERFMLRVGFVRTRRVLYGLSGISEETYRVLVGLRIFGSRYFEIAEQSAVLGIPDLSGVSVEQAATALRKLGRAGISVAPEFNHASRIGWFVKRLRFKASCSRALRAWYLLPSIRFGLWERRDCTSRIHGGFLGFTWMKFDACLMWKVMPNIESKRLDSEEETHG